MLGGGGEVYHPPEDWRGLYNDLILSETRGDRPRPPRPPVYFNRYRGQYYYWDLDPYSVLGEHWTVNLHYSLLTWISIISGLLSFSVFVFFVIFRFITNNGGGRSLEYKLVDLADFISNKTTVLLQNLLVVEWNRNKKLLFLITRQDWFYFLWDFARFHLIITVRFVFKTFVFTLVVFCCSFLPYN